MRQTTALLLVVLVAPAAAAAGEFELTGFGGYTFPFYSQTFRYTPGPVSVPIPGVSVEQGGSFGLETSGAVGFGAAAAFYVSEGFGFEVRYDRADITLEPLPSSYSVKVTLPAPFDPVVADLDFPPGTANLEAAAPLSINLKMRTGGRVRLTVSGGASRLGDVAGEVDQTIGLGITVFDLESGSLQVSSLGVRATAPADGKTQWGGNLGLGFQIPLGERAALVLEGRGFYFPKRTVEWEPVADRPLTGIEQALLARVLESLPPVEFEPWWVQASAGIAIRF